MPDVRDMIKWLTLSMSNINSFYWTAAQIFRCQSRSRFLLSLHSGQRSCCCQEARVLQMNLRSNWHKISRNSRANGQLWFYSQYHADTVSAATRWAEMTAATLSRWDFLFNNWCLGRWGCQTDVWTHLQDFESIKESIPTETLQHLNIFGLCCRRTDSTRMTLIQLISIGLDVSLIYGARLLWFLSKSSAPKTGDLALFTRGPSVSRGSMMSSVFFRETGC